MELVGVISIYDADHNLIDFVIGDRDIMANVSTELKVPVANLSSGITIEFKAVEPETESPVIAKRLFSKVATYERKKKD